MTEQNNTQDVVERTEIVPVEVNALAVMERAEIDSQIATAKQFPRSLATFIKQAKDMVSVDEETAESCIYRRPVGKEGNQVVYAEGESIRLAEMVAACYGNLRVSAVITEMTPRYIKAVGFAHDLEKNYAAKSEVVESTVTKQGVPYSERMKMVVAKATLKKAMRDAIFSVVPKSLFKSVTNLAREIAFGKTQMPLDKRREGLMQWIAKIGIEQDRLFSALGIKGVEEIGIEQLEILTGLKTAIKDGDCSVEEAFPPIVKEGEVVGKGTSALQKKIEKQKPPKKEVVAEQPAEAKKDVNSLRPKWYCDACNQVFVEPKKQGDDLQCPLCNEVGKNVHEATEQNYKDAGYAS